MAAKLKVFAWSDGFHAFTVATTSRPKALEAWGSKQDLFATGLARPLTGGPDYDAALAAPGEVITRSLAIDLGKIGKARRSRTRGPSRAKAARIKTLQAALANLDQSHQAAMADFDAQQTALDAARRKAKARHATDRQTLLADLEAVRASAQ